MAYRAPGERSRDSYLLGVTAACAYCKHQVPPRNESNEFSYKFGFGLGRTSWTYFRPQRWLLEAWRLVCKNIIRACVLLLQLRNRGNHLRPLQFRLLSLTVSSNLQLAPTVAARWVQN